MRILLVLLLSLLVGCSTISIHKTDTDCTATYTSILKSSSDISMMACGAEGGAKDSKDEVTNALMSLLARGLK